MSVRHWMIDTRRFEKGRHIEQEGKLDTECVCTGNMLWAKFLCTWWHRFLQLCYTSSYLNTSLSVCVWQLYFSESEVPNARFVPTTTVLSRLPKVFICGIPDTIVTVTNKEEKLAYYKMGVSPEIVLPSSLSSCWFVRVYFTWFLLYTGLVSRQVHLWELGSREPYWLPDRLPIKCAASYLFLVPLPST